MPLSTAKRVKQLLLHLLLGKEGVEMSAAGGLQAAGTSETGCWHLQHWVALPRAWKVRGGHY